MMKVVIDKSIGGMELSQEAKEWLYENAREKFFGETGIEPMMDERVEPTRLDPERFEWDRECREIYDGANKSWWYFDSNGTLGNMPEDWDARADEDLIHAVEEFGGNDQLKVVEVPDDVEWYVDLHEDGSEFIREKHRTWA